MPITVNCPGCSAKFNVKDGSAGKRGKCPKCGEPITVPGGESAPAPVRPVAAPVVARPRPADDDDDAPKPKRRRDDDEPDDRPRAKKRRDEDDDRPRRSRRDDDDRPRKKKSALPLVLGILGGVLLLCGGGAAGVWFGVIAPAAAKARAEIERKKAELDRKQAEIDAALKKELDEFGKAPEADTNPPAAGVTAAAAGRVKAGMTQRQVDEVLGGPGKAGNKSATDEAIANMEGDTKAVGERWHAATMEGRVFVWSKGADKVLVGYTAQPGTRGGTVSGVIGLFDGVARELLPLGGGTAPPTGSGTKDPPKEPPADGVISAYQLTSGAKPDYVGQTVTVRGKVRRAYGGVVILHTPKGLGCTCNFAMADFEAAKFTERDVVEIRGVVKSAGTLGANVEECKLVRRTAAPPTDPVELSTTELIEAYMADPAAADAKYGCERVKITGVVEEDGRLFYLKGKVEKGSRHSVVVVPGNSKNKAWQTAKPGDTVTAVVLVANYGQNGMHMELTVYETGDAK